MANKQISIKSAKYNKGNTSSKTNSIIMKVLVVLGVIILCFVIVYLMNYFFVEKSYIKINISTDKKLEYITIEGEEELITTQKYVSDLNYSMRYDIDNFTVFKYKSQDIFKFVNDEKILVVVEESGLPNSCSTGSLDMTYNNCYVQVDNYTEEHYISTNGKTYKLTVKSPNTPEYQEGMKIRINYMLNSFEMIL
ncbi:MAG: hypothetical protein E7161_04160 [Firmicutes bacterium]|nr:hypothetical protein [Bacillota bacterium]